MEVIRNNMAARQSDLRLYLDVIPEGSKLEPPPGSIMVFLKHFDTTKQTLYGVGKSYVPRNSKVGDLFPIINERMRWTPGTPLKLYEVGHRLTTCCLPQCQQCCYVGNQAWHDRAYESQEHLCSK